MRLIWDEAKRRANLPNMDWIFLRQARCSIPAIGWIFQFDAQANAA
ncbi:hypothetical protein ACUH78_01995 [Thauera sp. ZXT1-4]|jgi:hypothetical protein